MCDPTVQSPIYQSFRSYLKDSLLASSLPISTQTVNYQDSSPRIELAHHSTETAVLKVLTDILLAVDAGDLSALALLDLSAAFYTVDHGIFLHRLDSSYQIVGSVQQ